MAIDRYAHAPMEGAAAAAKEAAARQVQADLDSDLHSAEVQAAHTGRPTPAQAVARGVTP